MNGNNIKQVQGDDWDFTVTVRRKSDGSVVDLTGAVAWFTVKDKLTDSDAQAKVQVEIAGLGTDGQIGVHVPHESTDLVLDSYYYDVQLRLLGDKIKTVKRGQLEVVWQATMSTTQ